MTDQERAVMQQALEALEDAKALLNNKDRTTTMWFADEITALHAALAQQPEPVQEPVAWMYPDDYAGILKHQSRAEVFQKAWCNPAVCVPLYTAPPQQPEPVQEPVAIVRSVVGPGDDGVRIKWLRGFPQIGDPLYTTPPQRKPLTDEEMLGIIDAELEGGSLLDVARAIERKVRGEEE